MKLFWRGFAVVAVLGLVGCPKPEPKEKGLGGDDTPVTVGDGSIKITFENLPSSYDPKTGLRGSFHFVHPNKAYQMDDVETDAGANKKPCKQKDCVVIVTYADGTEVWLEPRGGQKGLIVFNSKGFDPAKFSYVTNKGWVYEDGTPGHPDVKESLVDDNSGNIPDTVCAAAHCGTRTHYKR